MIRTCINSLFTFFRNLLKSHQTLLLATGNSAWLAFEKALRIFFGFFIGVWITRYLGPTQFGQFSYAIGFSSLFSVLGGVGINSVVVRDLVILPDQKNVILCSAFFLRFIGGIFAFIFSLFFIYFLHPTDIILHWLVGITSLSIVFQASEIVDLWFQSNFQSKYSVLAKSLTFLFVSFFRILLILNNAKLIAFAYMLLIESALTAFALLGIFRVKGNIIHMSWSLPSQTGRLLKDSWPFIVSGIAVMIYLRIDVIMIKEIAGEWEAGIYAASTNISEAGYFFPLIIVGSSFPAILKYRKFDFTSYLISLRKLYFVLFWVSFFLALLLSLFSTSIIQTIYGENYNTGAPVLAIHIWAIIPFFLGVANSHYFLAESSHRMVFYKTITGAICNIALNFWLIPLYGNIGAAISTLISYFLSLFSIILFKNSRSHAIFLLQSFYFKKV